MRTWGRLRGWDYNYELVFQLGLYFLPEDNLFWREDTSDGIYGVTCALTRTGSLSRARYIGNQLSLPVQLQIDRHLTYTIFYSRFFGGRYLKETPPGRSVTYVSTFITYKF